MKDIPIAPVTTGWMRVSFDAEQLSRHLCWTLTNGGKDIFQRYGRNAGALLFEEDMAIRIAVTGYGPPDTFDSFEILSATLSTVPKHGGDTSDLPYAPSPFHNENASMVFNNFAAPTGYIVDPTIDRKYGISLSSDDMKVIQTCGRWELSLVLTVRLTLKGLPAPIVRVFSFDPESEVGNGTRPSGPRP